MNQNHYPYPPQSNQPQPEQYPHYDNQTQNLSEQMQPTQYSPVYQPTQYPAQQQPAGQPQYPAQSSYLTQPQHPQYAQGSAQPQYPDQYQQAQPAYKPPTKSHKKLVIVAVLLATVLVLGASGAYIFRDKLFDTATFSHGVKPSWSLTLPNSAGKTYVEPINDEKLIVVHISEKEVSASEINLPEKVKRHYSNTSKPKASTDFRKLSKPVKNLPSCNVKSERPYHVESGKLVCNNEKLKTVKLSSMPALERKAKGILPETVKKVGTIDDIDIYKTDTPDKISTLFGVNKDKLVWSRTYSDPIQPSVSNGSIWVSTPKEIIELAPATSAEYKKISKEDPSILDLSPKDQARLRAYYEYSKVLNTPDKYRYPEDDLDDLFKTAGYRYALVKLDKSGIPALLLVHQLADDSGNFGPSRMSLYLYQDTAHKLIKYDKPISLGVASVGGARAGLVVPKDESGLWYLEWSSGTGEGQKRLIQAKDGQIKVTKTLDFNIQSDNGGDGAVIKEYLLSEREPLIEALKIKFLEDNQQQKYGGESINPNSVKHDKEVAQAKKDGYKTYDGALKIMSIEELKKLYPEFMVAIGNQEGYFPASYKIAALVLPKKTMITAHNGDGIGYSTGPAVFIYLASEKHGDGFKQLQEYNGKQVTLAAKHLWWASDVGPYGNQPFVGDANKIIP